MNWLSHAANAVRRFFYRPADFVIGEEDRPYMFRWWIIPRNRFFNIYLHKVCRNDDDRALHDHPWPSLSFVLTGQVREITRDGARILRRGRIVPRSATFRHRLELIDGHCWTLFFTGPRVRDWGFWCPQGFVPWQLFCSADDSSKVGRGCGESEA